jgi:hypothetical protein
VWHEWDGEESDEEVVADGDQDAAENAGIGGRKKPRGTNYMLGYLSETHQWMGDFEGSYRKMNDPMLRMADGDQEDRAADVQELNDDTKVSNNQLTNTYKEQGCRGLPALPNTLEYLSYNNMYLVPFAHAFLYGVVKSFVAYAFRKSGDGKDVKADDCVRKESRATITRRGKQLELTSDFGRRYKDFQKYSGSYRMEDWQNLVETFSLYLFMGDVLPPKLRQVWNLIRDVCLHYMRPLEPSQCTEQARKAAAEKLHMIGVLYETFNFPASMMTPNLHMLVCRIPWQEEARGVVCVDLEYWVERIIRRMKDIVHGRVSADPEKTFVNAMLVEHSLALLAVQNPALLRLWRWLDHSHTDEKLKGDDYDFGDWERKLQLLGKGLGVPRFMVDRWRAAVVEYVNEMSPPDWSAADVTASFSKGKLVRSFKRASIRDDVLLGTASSHKGRLRQNCWVKVSWGVVPARQAGGRTRKRLLRVDNCVCLIRGFVRVSHPMLQAAAAAHSTAVGDLHSKFAHAVRFAEHVHKQAIRRLDAVMDADAINVSNNNHAQAAATREADYRADLVRIESEHAQSSETVPLRLAICQVFAAQDPVDGLFVAKSGDIAADTYAVDIDTIDCKLVACFPEGRGNGTMYFAPFQNLSKSF